MATVVAAVVADIVGGFIAGLVGGGAVGTFIGSVAAMYTYSVIVSAIQINPLDISSADFGNTIRNTTSTVTSHRIIYGKRRVGGQIFFITTTESNNIKYKDEPPSDEIESGDNLFAHIAIALAGHECQSVDEIYFGDTKLELDEYGYATNADFIIEEEITRTNEAGLPIKVDVEKQLLRVNTNLGSVDQLADSDMVANIPEWTDNHRARGICYLYLRLQYNKDKLNQTKPITAIVRGKKVYDSRTSETVWSENPALCIRDYILGEYGLNASSDEINEDFIIEAANACDETVQIDQSTNQKRYTCNIVLSRGSTRINNLNEIISTLAGSITYTQGKFRVHVGKYDVPITTIDESWLIAPAVITTRPSRENVFNAIKGIYIDNDSGNYEPVDFSPVTNSTYEAEDNNERIFREIVLPGTLNTYRAQRIAKLILEKGRQGIMLELSCNFNALQLAVWDNVYINIDQFGFSNKIFKILNWEFNESGKGINIIAQEESESAYDWNFGEATTIDPAPDTILPNPFFVTPPGAPQITEELYITNNSASVKTKAIVTWASSGEGFISHYQLEYKLETDTDFTIAGQTDGLELTIFDLEAGKYEFRVKTVNTINSSSDYSSNIKVITGLTAIPADITGFSLNAINNNAHLTWDEHPDLDVRIGGKIIVKYYPVPQDAAWSTSVFISDYLPGNSTNAVVPLLDGAYLIKASDSLGNESQNAVTIVTDITDIVRMNVVATSQQQPGFTGVKVNMDAESGILSLAINNGWDELTGLWDSQIGLWDNLGESVLWDDISGLWDDVPGFWDYGGAIIGYKTSGSYEFDNYVDLGSIYKSRLLSKINAIISDPDYRWDDIEGLWDDIQGFFDGQDITGIIIKLFVRTTNDDPAGTPTWSDWREFIVGDYTARAFEFKIEVTSPNSIYNVLISELEVEIDMPDFVQSNSDTTLNTGRKTITYVESFFTAPEVGVTILNGATGDYFDIQNIAATSFELGVKDSSNNFVIRTINYLAKGY